MTFEHHAEFVHGDGPALPTAGNSACVPDDRHADLMQKLEAYRAWRVSHIWVIDPGAKRFSIYTQIALENVSSFAFSEHSLQLTPAEVFGEL